MELYLRWLERYERKAGRGTAHRPDPLRRERSRKPWNFWNWKKAASAWRLTGQNCCRDLLKRKLHEAVIAARERLSQIKAEKEQPVLLPENKGK